MRSLLLAALAALTLTLLGGPGLAWADGEASFGIRPTTAFEDRPESFAYFSRVMEPGAVVTDEALVTNDGDVPITLRLYAVDAVNGGTTFAKQDQEITGVSRWLSLSATEVSLAPGEARVVPFTITVPADAAPGEHVAGLVLETLPSEAAPAGSSGEAQFQVQVIRRVGVAVLIEVPGPRTAGLTFTDAGLYEQDDLGATFIVDVENTGNVSAQGEGFLIVSDLEGTELASIPVTVDTVLPGQATSIYVRHPIRLADAKYLLAGTLSYHSVLGDEQGVAAPLPGVELKIEDGQPAAPKSVEAARPSSEPVTLTGTADEGTPLARYAPYAATILALGVLAVAVIIWRRTRSRWLVAGCLPLIVVLAVVFAPRLADQSSVPPSANDATPTGIVGNADPSIGGPEAESIQAAVALEAVAEPPEPAVGSPTARAAGTLGGGVNVAVGEPDPPLGTVEPAAEALGGRGDVVVSESDLLFGMVEPPSDENESIPTEEHPEEAGADADPNAALYEWPDIALYLVEPGDTLLDIAAAFGTSAEAIMALNDISDAGILFAGATLSVPVNYTDPVTSTPGDTMAALETWGRLVEYEVKPGDSFAAIATEFLTTPSAIALYNELELGEPPPAGRTIVIPWGFIPPPE